MKKIADLLDFVDDRFSFGSDQEVREILGDAGIRMVSDLPVAIEVGSILPTISVQWENAKRKGVSILGIEELFSNLSDLNSNEVIEQYGVVSETSAGNFYFKEDGSFLGFRVIERGNGFDAK